MPASSSTPLVAMPDAHAISLLLAERAPELCRVLLPAGRQVSGHWHVGSVDGEPGNSLEVELTGTKAGLWLDRASDDKGDALDLVRAVLGLEMAEAIRWSRRWLGIPVVCRPAEPDGRRWSPRADTIWQSTGPLTDSIGAAYLAGRGCALPDSDDVRFHAGLNHWPTMTTWPALVSRVTDAVTCKPMTLHFTFIAHDGSAKAPVDKPRLLLPKHIKAGGVVRLVDDAEVTTGLGIAEGIETGLSIMATGWRPVWAAIDAGNLARFPTLDGIETLTVFADHDPAGIKAARDVADRWIQARREASITLPRKRGTDWNDELQEAAA